MMAKMKYTQTDRQIVPKIGTERYHLAKYLAKNVSPLGQSAYTINTITSTFDVMGKIKNKQVFLEKDRIRNIENDCFLFFDYLI